MKFSKVNNYKTAVTGGSPDPNNVINDSGKTGILYRDPARKGRKAVESDISFHVDRQTRAAQRLYRIFNPAKKGKKKGKAEYAAQVFDNALPNKRDLGTGMFTAERLYQALVKQCDHEHFHAADDQIDQGVDLYLRRSLYQTSAGTVKSMLKSAVQGRKWDDLTDVEKRDISLFLENLEADYRYDKVKKHVVSSIEHQNIMIQPDNEGKLVPAPIPLASSRNKAEKDALVRFLSEYAVIDECVRHGLRVRLRRLVDLYFYGRGEVETDDFNEWDDHVARRDRTEPFSQEAAAFIKAAREEDVRRQDARKQGSRNVKDGKDRLKVVKEMYRAENLQRYRASVKAAEADPGLYFKDTATSKYWIHHIENSVERIYRNFRSLEDYRLSLGYLSEKVWKGMIAFLCGKYIAAGKAVYHFAMEDGLEDPDKSLNLGKIRDEAAGGMTSFDYEQIRAEELLQRETAVYVAFAANHLASATVDLSALGNEANKEDFLMLGREDLEKAQKPHLRRNILQFFGGASTWKDFPFEQYYRLCSEREGTVYDDLSLLKDLQQIIYAIRNESFHFDTRKKDPGGWNQELIAGMFAHDCRTASRQQKEKAYSNNLPMFYGDRDLLAILQALYQRQVQRASQVPSFNKVLVRRNFSEYISSGLGWKNIHFPGEDSVIRKEQFDSALYYLLKEIYYNLFLQGQGMEGRYDVRAEFLRWCMDPANGEENTKAFESFQSRVNELVAAKKDMTMPELCQRIMTDYNLFNNKVRKVKSDYVKQNSPDSYDHFKMLLFKGIREVFASYINAQFPLLKSPKLREKPEAEEFLADYSSPMYDSLVRQMRENIELQKWYVVGRLLNPRQANFFVGVLRQYIQYTGQIRRRAQDTGNVSRTNARPKTFKVFASVLDLCIQLSGITTNDLEDYFEDKDDYAGHISNYLAFEGEYPGISLSGQLERFCNESDEAAFGSSQGHKDRSEDFLKSDRLFDTGTEELKRIGVFYDADNPILNRNILLSRIYGTEKVLMNIERDRKITREDIKAFYEQRKKIDAYRITGKCSTEEQQRDLKKYQEIKNRVEFRDLVEYEEIIDELQAKMIDWCYLRERDLMYFQLGFHYTCLQNDSPKGTLYKRIEHEGRSIDGAILYQIAAMYIYGVPIYSVRKSKVKRNSGTMQTGEKIRPFLRYADACIEEAFPATDTNAGASDVESQHRMTPEQFYYAGMELFENISEHDNIIGLRNYIEHFHYYVRQDRSILDLYGEIFDRFFSYDLKCQKNVCNVLYNILMRHFVKPGFGFSTAEKVVGKDITKKRAAIFLREGTGLASEQMTYKLLKNRNEKTDSGAFDEHDMVKLNARSRDFLEGVALLLCYPERPGDVIRDLGNDRLHSNRENSAKRSGNRIDRKEKGSLYTTSQEGGKARGRNRKENDHPGRGSGQGNSSGSFGTSLADLLKGIRLDE